VGVVGFGLVCLLVSLPRWRETARMAGCQQNLMRIGVGLQLYHQAARRYPTVPTLGGSVGDSPFKAMLDSLALPDFLELKDPGSKPKPTVAAARGVRVPGLSCPSDPHAMTRLFNAPISYRGNAGDTPDGLHGPFEPGRVVTAAGVEAADGLSFTAAFAERLVGDGRDDHPAPINYASTPGPVGGLDNSIGPWRGDAGSDWAEAAWRSTLYNHALMPGSPAPSRIAVDGGTAAIGASSAHPNRINVLLLDGSLRVVTPTINPDVWRALATTGVESAPTPPAK